MEKIELETIPLAQISQPGEGQVAFDTEVFIPEGVCAKMIRFAVEEGKISHLDFTGGCDGNLKAISKLLIGMNVNDVIEKLEGLTCRKKSTSCVDQLCVGLRGYKQ